MHLLGVQRLLISAPGIQIAKVSPRRIPHTYPYLRLLFSQRDISPEEEVRLRKIRNIGISAHIDSGKTTLTERILYYTGRIGQIHEVRGKDKVGAKMDSMELEREKGITIKSAATYTVWNGMNINIIDTPGHIDFTFEVERALKVLDSAILVICAVSGIQSQSVTVNNQMNRYNVPRVCFINKLDRDGANVERAISQMKSKLGLNPLLLHIPIGIERDFKGVVDIIEKKGIYNRGAYGSEVVESEVPSNLVDLMEEKREELIETLVNSDEEFGEVFLSDNDITNDQIKAAIRRFTISRKGVPVLLGSALQNKGVQTLLNAVCDYAPAPHEVKNFCLDLGKNEQEVQIAPYTDAKLIAFAFKLEEGKFGQLTYVRIYQGHLEKGRVITNTRTNKTLRVGRLVRMHSDEMEEVNRVESGEICAVFGVDCSSGDTFTNGDSYAMSPMYVPPAVVSLNVKVDPKCTQKFMKALNRFQREDLTFNVDFDPETRQTTISGMGELHLEIYIEIIKREYGIECKTGKPEVAFRETILEKMPFSYTHKKQSGGSGQYAKIDGYIEPVEIPVDSKELVEFVDGTRGNSVDPQYIPSVRKGFLHACKMSPIAGYKMTNIRFVLTDGKTHPVDSSDMAFSYAAIFASRKAFMEAKTGLLEPVMSVCFTAPIEYQSLLAAFALKRRGELGDIDVTESCVSVHAEIPLNDMFGAYKELASITKGEGSFTMEYKSHKLAPEELRNSVTESRKEYIKTHIF